MSVRDHLQKLLLQEDLNFLLTNRLPRRWLTQFMGRFSKIEQPLVRDFSIAVWKFFSGLDLSEAKKNRFTSLHDCFIRELRDGLRPVATDPATLTSPCDGIVGAHGPIEGAQIFQAKGFPYTLEDLLGEDAQGSEWRNGYFVTLRLTSCMYHRFHAPQDCVVEQVTYFSGDTWNVNPIALRRVEKLFCKNERAFIKTRVTAAGPCGGKRIALIPVAAILVASIRLHFLNVLLHLKYRGPRRIACDAAFVKGQEMGWFQHGSTIIVLAPKGFVMCDGLYEGTVMRTGQALMHWAGRAE
ncbi:MAG TPA: archaetidylserine decarboxylase [Burkholderiales bacterium]|nr:archaetidylserine decarboxylase [Burkholderiales bacterium]